MVWASSFYPFIDTKNTCSPLFHVKKTFWWRQSLKKPDFTDFAENMLSFKFFAKNDRNIQFGGIFLLIMTENDLIVIHNIHMKFQEHGTNIFGQGAKTNSKIFK